MSFLGFETIGNATVIAYDDGPVVATDPWMFGAAYFGSWGMPFEVPAEQQDAIKSCEYIWLSHGHPDHIQADSLEQLKGRKILLPDHVGNRIRDDLLEAGFDVTVLEDRKWVRLSDNIQVYCLSDFFQDAVLLIDVGGVLLINLNDATDRGWGRALKKEIRKFDRRFLLKLLGYGDVDMFNFFDETGNRIVSTSVKKRPIGEQLEFYADLYGATDALPFSCFHHYQREDSIWANDYVTPLSAFHDGFSGERVRLHEPFLRFDCRSGEATNLQPKRNTPDVFKPEDFDDNWSDMLDPDDTAKLDVYFKAMEGLADNLDYVRFRVGGKEHVISLSGRGHKKGVTFETPRGSLMTAAEYEVFDDLLIGNFTKTTLHGDWEGNSLHPEFTPFVAKYADNGRAKSKDELDRYFEAYRQRAPMDHLLHMLERESERKIRAFVGSDTPAFRAAKKAYLFLKKA